MLKYSMFMCILITCTAYGQPSEQILKRAQQICEQCTTQEAFMQPGPHTQICAALAEFCSLSMATRESQKSSIPVIASDDLMAELEGDDLGEFPHKDEIAAYRPSDSEYRPDQIRELYQKLPPLVIKELIRLHKMQERKELLTRMFPIRTTTPKVARDMYGSAYNSMNDLDKIFKRLQKSKMYENYASLESSYIGTANLFLMAHDQGSPYALKEAQKFLFSEQLKTITEWKAQHMKIFYNPDIAQLCGGFILRSYFDPKDAANAEALYCFAQVALANIHHYYKAPHEQHGVHVPNTLFEQGYYVIAHQLLKAHDLGHPLALKEVEDMMTRGEILSIVEQKKIHKVYGADTEFAAIWREITMRKYHTQSIADAQHSASSSSLQIATDQPVPAAPLPPCSSSSPCNSCSSSDEPPIDDPKG